MTDSGDDRGARARRPRVPPASPEVEESLARLLDHGGVDAERDLHEEAVRTLLRMSGDGVDRGDLKIVSGALRELRSSFAKFAPVRDRRKVSVFGSARTDPRAPQYRQAVDLGAALAARGWMVISGGGPGIMTAAVEGAGPEHSFVVTIRLPFEKNPGARLVDESHWVHFRYFFTRKLTFVKESAAFAIFPGGFGTMDETFELLTLLQTGKATPAPVVLIDPPGESYWATFRRFVEDELVADAMVSPEDLDLLWFCSDPEEAVERIVDFYRVYHSMRWVGRELVIRLTRQLPAEAVAMLNDEYGDIVTDGRIEATGPRPEEVTDDDHVDLPRLALHFDNHHFSRLASLVVRLGTLDPS